MKSKSLYLVTSILLALVLFVIDCSKPEEGKQAGTAKTDELIPGQALPDTGAINGQLFSRPQVAEVGRFAPGFELQDTEGKIWKLSDLKGQVVFLNFWATWCPPCREEMPSMQELFEVMPRDSFKMLSVLSNDDPDLAVSFAKKGGFDFPILIDPGSRIGQVYGLTGVPETYIIDKQGVLRQKYLGPRHWSSQVAKDMLTDYINR